MLIYYLTFTWSGFPKTYFKHKWAFIKHIINNNNTEAYSF